MSHTRRSVTAALAALALGGSMVASTAPAEAHTYTKVGTVSAQEARKLFKETFKQRCLTEHEVQHIAHGAGSPTNDDHLVLSYNGTKKSHINFMSVDFDEDGCVYKVTAYKL